MFCKKCGKQISDTALFCVYCGTRVTTDEKPPVSDSSDPADETAFLDLESVDDDSTVILTDRRPQREPASEPYASHQAEPQPTPQPGPQPTPWPNRENMGSNVSTAGETKKKSHKALILLILIVIVLAAALVFLLRGVFGGKSVSTKVFYIRDDELSFVPNMKSSDPETVDIDKLKNSNNVVRFSEDGSYLYYYSKIDNESNLGTLCRIPVNKLKDDESSNDDLIEELDKNVSVDERLSIIDNSAALYVRKNDELTYYEKGESYELADEVNSGYWLTDDEKYAVYTVEEGDGKASLHIVSVSKDGKEEEIDSNIDGVLEVGDSDFILYKMDYDSEDRSYDIYLAGAGKAPELIVEDVYSFLGYDEDEESFYYMVRETQETSLYSYVIDQNAEAEADATEPRAKDYLASVEASQAISSDDAAYYSDMGSFLSRRVVRSSNMNDAFGMYGYYNYDDGRNYFYNDSDGSWYVYNEDGYQNAYQEYLEANERNELRSEIKTRTIEQPFYHLFYYKDGKTTEICESVSGTIATTPGAVVYGKMESGEVTVQRYIEDVYDADALEEEVENELLYGGIEDADEFYCSVAGKEENTITDFDTISSIWLSEDGKTAVISGNYDGEYEYEIISYDIDGNGLGKSTDVTDAGWFAGVDENTFYYYEDMDDEEADLYKYDGSKSTLLAKKVVWQRGVFVADDGTVVGYSDWDFQDIEGELAEFGKNGKDETVRKDVSGYRYLGSGTYLFVKDEDLYYQNKKGEDTRLAKDVSGFWHPDAAEGFYVYAY